MTIPKYCIQLFTPLLGTLNIYCFFFIFVVNFSAPPLSSCTICIIYKQTHKIILTYFQWTLDLNLTVFLIFTFVYTSIISYKCLSSQKIMQYLSLYLIYFLNLVYFLIMNFGFLCIIAFLYYDPLIFSYKFDLST